jgi:hypothetical protein
MQVLLGQTKVWRPREKEETMHTEKVLKLGYTIYFSSSHSVMP